MNCQIKYGQSRICLEIDGQLEQRTLYSAGVIPLLTLYDDGLNPCRLLTIIEKDESLKIAG